MRTLFTKFSRHFIVLSVCTFVLVRANAQLKIGDNPTTINKSSILELESSNQGLLLTRLSDTTTINGFNPPDGMIIYLTTDNSLRLRSNGAWRKIAEFQGTNAIQAINGVAKQTLTLTASASDTSNNVLVQSRSVDSTIAIYLPIQDGSAGALKQYGFLTYADWQKIRSGVQEVNVGPVSATPDANGISITTLDSLRTIVLHAATATTAGVVTAGTQTFGGSKTFQDSVIINGKLALNNVSNNTTSDSVLVYNGGVVEKRVVSASAFGNAIRSINGNRDTAQKIAFRNSGVDLTVSTNSADSIFLNVPDAGASARGVVSTAAQTFAGDKTFQDSVVASKTLKAGSAGTANSTMQVDGSISLGIRTINSSQAALATDNTILANTTGGAITITLPAPTDISGRVYTIKKIGTGGINNALTITPSTGITIDGGTSYTIYNDWTYVTIQTDGSSWYIIKR